MRSEIVYASGEEIKKLVQPLKVMVFNGYKYYLTDEELERLENSKTYVIFQKYGILFIKPLHGEKSVIVKRGEKIPKKSE